MWVLDFFFCGAFLLNLREWKHPRQTIFIPNLGGHSCQLLGTWRFVPQECKQLLPSFTAPSAGCGKFLPWCARLRWSATPLQMSHNTTQLLLKKRAYVRQSIVCTFFKNVTAFNWCYKYLWLESVSCAAHVTRLPWKEFPLEFKK